VLAAEGVSWAAFSLACFVGHGSTGTVVRMVHTQLYRAGTGMFSTPFLRSAVGHFTTGVSFSATPGTTPL
jgi:hypothetical protein